MFLVIACNEMVMSNLTVKEVRGWEDLGSLGGGACLNNADYARTINGFLYVALAE